MFITVSTKAPLVPNLSQLNPFHTHTPNLKVHLNISFQVADILEILQPCTDISFLPRVLQTQSIPNTLFDRSSHTHTTVSSTLQLARYELSPFSSMLPSTSYACPSLTATDTDTKMIHNICSLSFHVILYLFFVLDSFLPL